MQAPSLKPRLASGKLNAGRMQGLLQEFVAHAYLKGFRSVGDENDFDHGHILFAGEAPAARPAAILYHTQEMAHFYHRHQPGCAYDYLDPGARNWIQWLDVAGRIENARSYEREKYPESPEWELFQKNKLPGLREHGTITDQMLDPDRTGMRVASSLQWAFSRVDCSLAGGPDMIGVELPTKERVCLSLRSP